MRVNGVESAAQNGIYVSSSKEKKDSSNLGINDFFALMAAQLKSQSMMDTVDNTQFIAQMAQFSSLSQISELNSTIKSNMAVSLMGKTVSVTKIDNFGTKQTVVGKVEQISYNEGVPYLFIDGGYYQISDIVDIA